MGGFALNSDPWVLTPSQSSWSSAFSDYPWRRPRKEAWPCMPTSLPQITIALPWIVMKMDRHEEAQTIKKVTVLGSRQEDFAALIRTFASDPI
ncbi:hypothetical protein JMJ77_0001017 [Colletotrichum scovillei]|uniref:Uncharacterized protein n=1 Tax=Colletotrichum scovillei TaxID=1209932 RepID=A0A9P7RDC8_9PEZI|nr:hypothetical protein JMJ77_0001017 [Colletotrichum scovillei]KAG7072237.1 hypothetical protein JMJ76_0005093 [Colletotrichum scovillei]KAG7080486.1 hypothetical protein JMJ78_0007580 [Colletotrichum scovillei]